jgi:hypothetical protein
MLGAIACFDFKLQVSLFLIIDLSCLGLWLTFAISSGNALALISVSMSVSDAVISETLQCL